MGPLLRDVPVRHASAARRQRGHAMEAQWSAEHPTAQSGTMHLSLSQFSAVRRHHAIDTTPICQQAPSANWNIIQQFLQMGRPSGQTDLVRLIVPMCLTRLHSFAPAHVSLNAPPVPGEISVSRAMSGAFDPP
jgi:hypothetical protein